MAHPLADRLRAEGRDHFWIAFTVYHGRLTGRDVSRDHFDAICEGGSNFAKANFNFTISDELVANPRFGPNTGDVFAVPDPESLVSVPFRPRTALAHCTLYDEDGGVWDGCPRGALQRAVEALAAAGLTARVGFEPEFYLLDADGQSPANSAGMYSIAGLDEAAGFVAALTAALPEMGVRLEQIGKEYGTGQYEANLAHDHPLAAADELINLRLAVRHLAAEAGLHASFMPKLDEKMAGSGLHVHLSLQDAATGQDRTGEPGRAGDLSEAGSAFMAGWLDHAEALTALGAPTPNSYKRLQPATWAPAHICWGIGNRGALVRVPGRGKRARLEFRSGDNTANPYLFLAGLIWAGLDGIAQQRQPGPPAGDDVALLGEEALIERGIRFLPRDLQDALDALADDAALASGLGPVIHGEFLRIKRAELASYRLQVSEWERTHYLDQP